MKLKIDSVIMHGYKMPKEPWPLGTMLFFKSTWHDRIGIYIGVKKILNYFNCEVGLHEVFILNENRVVQYKEDMSLMHDWEKMW